MDLQESREVIKQVDEEMAKLFERRMEAVREIAAFKKERGLPIEDKEQEARAIKGRSATDPWNPIPPSNPPMRRWKRANVTWQSFPSRTALRAKWGRSWI